MFTGTSLPVESTYAKVLPSYHGLIELARLAITVFQLISYKFLKDFVVCLTCNKNLLLLILTLFLKNSFA